MDATVGGGGHAALLRGLGAELLAVDRDPEAIAAARARLGEDGIRYSTGPFGSAKVLGTIETFRPDRILLDLGVSSHQLDTDARGFTFRPGAPLDMRMAPGRGVTAADVLNTWPAERLADAFAELADERQARKLARVIVRRRGTAPFATSDDFVNAIREALGPRSGPADFARLFQALRIVVNHELDSLEAGLPAAFQMLRPGGRLAVIGFHSLEDRITKRFLRDKARGCTCPPELPVCVCGHEPELRILTPKPIRPTPGEVALNPRATSARLRAAVKV